MTYHATESNDTSNDRMGELDATSRRKVYYLEESPEKIWKNIFTDHPEDSRHFLNLCAMFREMAFSGARGEFAELLASSMYGLVYRRHGSFIEESDWFAHLSEGNLSRVEMAFVQRAYTWAHIGCSTMCTWDQERQENVCMRSLDWQGAPVLSKVTRIFDFIGNNADGSDSFTSVGVVGMLGVLTGMKPGFSAAINYAPWYKSSLDKDMDPTFKLRKLLQNPSINSFEKALGAIENWEVSSPVFLTLCGGEKDQACVVEIGHKDKTSTRYSQNGLLVQTNNFDANGAFKDVEGLMPEKKKQKPYPVDAEGVRLENDDWYSGKLIPSSAVRRTTLEEKFKNFNSSSKQLEESLLEAYAIPPVWNWETAYWALMRPRSNAMRVFSRVAS